MPAGAQSGLVVVTADGAASDGVAFRVSGPAPVIATVNPTFGPEGTWVVIRGENFGSPIGAAQGRSGVSFNGVWTSPSSWSGTEVRAPVPEGVTSGLVVVRVDGAVSNGVEFSFEGTATRGDDYTMVETVTIEAGSKRERPQLTVIDDLIYEGAQTILIEASAEGYVTDNCLIQLGDNDPETGVTVSPSSLSITEGESGQYQVKLASQPSASVTIAIGSSNGDVEVNPASLTFTTGETGNWNVFQGVTVQVVHDDDSADEQATLTHTASSGDPNYAGIAGPGVSVQITDDDPAGVTVSPTSLSITEGESGQYQVKLISQPTAPVTLTLTSDNGDVQVPASLAIAPGDWNTAQTVTVQVAHDDDMEDETGTITHVASSGDRKYAGIAVDAVSVQITDEVPGVTVTPTRLSIRKGQSKSYQVRLKTRPSASVTISMSSSNGDVGVPSTPLTFTTATGATGGWDRFQSVTVRIAHDDNTSDESGTITHESSSNDPNYHERPDISAVSVKVTDDDPEEPENQPPVPVGTMPNPTLDERERKRIGLSPYFNDPDGDDLTYSASSSNANVEVSVTGSTLTIRGVSEGTATVTVTAKDPMRLSAKQTFDVTVEPPPGPEITSIRPGLQRPDDPVTIYGSNFGSVAGSVSFGGHLVGDNNFTGSDSDYRWSNTSISLLIPASAQPGTVSVTVTTSAGQTSNSKSYTITGGPLPRPEDECAGEEEDCPDDTKKGGGSNDAEEETDSEESEDSPEDGG